MNIGILKSKTTVASITLLVLSGVRLWAGDATALQGIQEAVMSIVPMLLRSAIYSDTARTTQAIESNVGDAAPLQPAADSTAQLQPDADSTAQLQPESGGA